MDENNQQEATRAHLKATSSTVEDVWNSLTEEEREAIRQSVAESRERLEEAVRPYAKHFTIPDAKHHSQIYNNLQTLEDAGFPESYVASIPFESGMSTEWIAQQLQGLPGYGPVGAELTRHMLKKRPEQDQSRRVASLLSELSESQIQRIEDGRCPTVDEAARLAVAYGITTAELLGIMDAEEVRLLSLYRRGTEEQRRALLAVIEPWGAKEARACAC